MKFTITMLALAAMPAFAQIGSQQKAPANTVAKAPAAPSPVITSSGGGRPARQLMMGIERQFDDKLSGADIKDPIDIIGPTRGIYLEGYGTVFTTEASLIQTPNTSAFKPVILDPEKNSVHERKLKHVALIETTMKDMIVTMAGALNATSFNDQVVLQVRLLYFQWENTTGLPLNITMKGDRKSVLAGNIQITKE